jgi:hypothetical protein
MTAYTFQNPTIQLKATSAARFAKRPTRYMSKNRRIEVVKQEIIKDELIRQGYLRMVQEHLPAMIAAHIEVAQMPSPKATAERKLLFQAAGLLSDTQNEQETAGNMLGRIFAAVEKRGDTFSPYAYE